MDYLEQNETYILPNGTVIHVMHDIDADAPMNYFPFFIYREAYRSRSIFSDNPEDSVLQTFSEYINQDLAPRYALNLTKRYYRTFSPELADYAANLKLGSWQGYNQGDWADYAYISDYDESTDINLYLQGDVSVVRIDYPNGETEWIGGFFREFGRVSGEDLNLDISQARVANRTVIYS